MRRDRLIAGQFIDLALLDVQIAALANIGTQYLMTGTVPKRHGNAHGSIVPYQDFQTKDGWIIIAVANDAQFARLAQIVGMPELANNPSYKSNADRVRNRAELLNTLEKQLRSRTSAEWIRELDREGIPAGPINALDAVFQDPQIAARGLLVDFFGPRERSARVVANPIKFSRTQTSHRIPPPALGEHTDEVLAETLDLGTEEVLQLRKKNVI
ncbi:MAG: CoA transferase [Candidatus Acidiferrales bacterium]